MTQIPNLRLSKLPLICGKDFTSLLLPASEKATNGFVHHSWFLPKQRGRGQWPRRMDAVALQGGCYGGGGARFVRHHLQTAPAPSSQPSVLVPAQRRVTARRWSSVRWMHELPALPVAAAMEARAAYFRCQSCGAGASPPPGGHPPTSPATPTERGNWHCVVGGWGLNLYAGAAQYSDFS